MDKPNVLESYEKVIGYLEQERLFHRQEIHNIDLAIKVIKELGEAKLKQAVADQETILNSPKKRKRKQKDESI